MTRFGAPASKSSLVFKVPFKLLCDIREEFVLQQTSKHKRAKVEDAGSASNVPPPMKLWPCENT